MGRGGGGLVVSALAFFSNDTSSNPDGYLKFLFKKTKINLKEAGGDASLEKLYSFFQATTGLHF